MTATQEQTEEEARVAAFLLDLSELSRRHGITISGCGCCGSPGIDVHNPEETRTGGYVHKDCSYLTWDEAA